jgi:hypothetical protein
MIFIGLGELSSSVSVLQAYPGIIVAKENDQKPEEYPVPLIPLKSLTRKDVIEEVTILLNRFFDEIEK